MAKNQTSISHTNPTFRKAKLTTNLPVSSVSYISLSHTLMEAVRNPEINNVGILGGFGAGKSSLLKTFREEVLPFSSSCIGFDNHCRKMSPDHSIIVSVSSLLDSNAKHDLGLHGAQKDDSSNFAGSSIINSVITTPASSELDSDYSKKRREKVEEQVVMDLLLSRPWRKLPDSSYHGKYHFRYRWIVYIAFSALSVFCCIFAWLFQNCWLCVGSETRAWLCVALWVAGAGFGLGLLTSFLMCNIPHRVAFLSKHLNVETDLSTDESKFDRYIADLTYFFMKTKTNLVIFEDADRLGDRQLLDDLRALNFQINMCEKIKNRKGVVFVYCVNSAVFPESALRSKFFDFSISLPSITDPYNVAEQFVGSPLFSCSPDHPNGGSSLTPNQGIIIDLSHFVTEKRLVNSILNDYAFFRLGVATKDSVKNQSDATAMFSLAIYKNLFSADYAKLIESDRAHCAFFAKDNDDQKIDLALFEFVQKIHEFKAIREPYLQYVSIFDSALFADETTKLAYEKIRCDTPAAISDIDAPVPSPKDVLNAVPLDWLKRSAFLNADLIRCLLKNHSDYEEEFDAFLKAFVAWPFSSQDMPSFYFLNKMFSTGYLSDDEAVLFSMRCSAYNPDFYSLLLSTSLWTTRKACYFRFLHQLMLAHEKTLPSLFKVDGNVKGNPASSLVDFIGEEETSLQYLGQFTDKELIFLFSNLQLSFSSLVKFPKSQASTLMVEFSAFDASFSNYCTILESHFGCSDPSSHFITYIYTHSIGRFVSYFKDNVSIIIAEGLVSDSKAFSKEEPSGILAFLRSLAKLDRSLLERLCNRFPKHSVPYISQLPPETAEIVLGTSLFAPTFDSMALLYHDLPKLGQQIDDYYYSSPAIEKATVNDEVKRAYLSHLLESVQSNTYSSLQTVIGRLTFLAPFTKRKLPKNPYGIMCLIDEEKTSLTKEDLIDLRHQFLKAPEIYQFLSKRIEPITLKDLSYHPSLRQAFRLYNESDGPDSRQTISQYMLPFRPDKSFSSTLLTYRSSDLTELDQLRLKFALTGSDVAKIYAASLRNMDRGKALSVLESINSDINECIKAKKPYYTAYGTMLYYLFFQLSLEINPLTKLITSPSQSKVGFEFVDYEK